MSLRDYLLRPWFVITLLCLLYCLLIVSINDGDALALVTIGTQFSEDTAEADGGTEGYDGQFVYFIARDPNSAAQYIDVPAYRFQRILLPILGRIFAFGQVDLIPWSLLFINLVALAGGTAILETLLRENNHSRWYAIGYALSLGVFGTVRLSLSEPLAYGLALGGILLVRREHWLWSAVLFAFAGLAKETALLIPAGYGLYLLIEHQWKRALLFGAIIGIPFMIWQLILYDRLGSFGIGSGGAMATGFEIIPLAGVIKILIEGGPIVFLLFLVMLGPFVLYPTYWALRDFWLSWKAGKRDPILIVMGVNAVIMLFVPFSTYRELLGILRFIIGLQIGIILYASERNLRRTLLNSTIWMVTVLFLIGSDLGGSSS